MKHLQHIHYRTVFKYECFVGGTPEYDALNELIDRNESEHYDVGLDPMEPNAEPGDLVVLLFRRGYYNDLTQLYTMQNKYAHTCVVHEKKGLAVITDFNRKPDTRHIDNFNKRCVRIIKKGTEDYHTVLGLCFHQLVPSVTPIPGIPTSM